MTVLSASTLSNALSGNLAGKVALVTGASRGIGAATARELARAGAHVIIHYGQAAQEAEALAAEIRGNGGKADIAGADLAAADGAHILAAQVRKLIPGKLDVLVANAGIAKMAPIADTSVADFDRLFAVNVRAPYFTVQQLLPVLADNASVIFTSSVVARVSFGTLAAYAATKGAINSLVTHLAAELGPRGIRVNAVAPGIIETDMSSFTRTEAGRELAIGTQALKRIGQPDDVAGAIAFLASDASRWITGDVITTSGGAKI
jgi:NAD(P)-dependent dehydrogenase (short-subunit alcohol dehydrogenase family)